MNNDNKFPPLTGDYYAQCNELFRSLTNQAEVMLKALHDLVLDEQKLKILSVGSGVGLFEVPMLQQLFEKEIEIALFIGIDNDEYACTILDGKLGAAFGTRLNYEVISEPFQKYQTAEGFDLILFNHVMEYFAISHLQSIRKSLRLRSEAGKILIFSPNRGGINTIYAATMSQVAGYDPFFANDLSSLLSGNAIAFTSADLVAACDISLLEEADEHADKIRLLSFLTQMDCRAIHSEMRERYSTYYRSLRMDQNHISHPTTLFVL